MPANPTKIFATYREKESLLEELLQENPGEFCIYQGEKIRIRPSRLELKRRERIAREAELRHLRHTQWEVIIRALPSLLFLEDSAWWDQVFQGIKNHTNLLREINSAAPNILKRAEEAFLAKREKHVTDLKKRLPSISTTLDYAGQVINRFNELVELLEERKRRG